MAQVTDIVAIPTITASSAYASGNQIGTLLTLTGVGPGTADGVELQNIVVLDKAGQSAAMDVLLFNAQPTVGSDKAAVNISAADLAGKCVGNFKVTAAMYSSAGTPSAATFAAPNLPICTKPATAANGGTANTLYAVLVSRGTPTYTSTSDLSVRFTFRWD